MIYVADNYICNQYTSESGITFSKEKGIDINKTKDIRFLIKKGILIEKNSTNVVEEVVEENLDINNDGAVDEKDISLASKVLQNVSKIKSKKSKSKK